MPSTKEKVYKKEVAVLWVNYCCLCHHGYTGLSSVETYDPKVNEWKSVASMNTRRSSVGVAVLNGKSLLRSSHSLPGVHLKMVFNLPKGVHL